MDDAYMGRIYDQDLDSGAVGCLTADCAEKEDEYGKYSCPAGTKTGGYEHFRRHVSLRENRLQSCIFDLSGRLSFRQKKNSQVDCLSGKNL